MRSIVLYSLAVVLVVVIYPFVGELLFGLGIRDMHIVAFVATFSLFYLKFQFYFATSSNLEEKSKDDIMSFIPAGVLLVVTIFMSIFYKGEFYLYWYINVFLFGLTTYIDISVGNYIGNLILKKTSEVTPMH